MLALTTAVMARAIRAVSIRRRGKRRAQTSNRQRGARGTREMELPWQYVAGTANTTLRVRLR